MPRAAGLFICTRFEKSPELVVLLQRRGIFNFETMEPETFPNGFQPTCHGSIEEEDEGDPRETINREGMQELDYDFADCPVQLVTPPEANAALYGLFLPLDELASDFRLHFRLHISTGGLVPFTLETFTRNVTCVPFKDRRTFPSTEKWGMVDDEYSGALEVFKRFKNA